MLSASPLVAVFPAEAAGKFNLEPPPAAEPWLGGEPSSVVLQAIWPRKQVEESQSAYCLVSHKAERIPIFVYNFGHDPVEGRLTVRGPKDWGLKMPEAVKVGPGERVELALDAQLPDVDPKHAEAVLMEGDFGPAGKPVLSLRLAAKSK